MIAIDLSKISAIYKKDKRMCLYFTWIEWKDFGALYMVIRYEDSYIVLEGSESTEPLFATLPISNEVMEL